MLRMYITEICRLRVVVHCIISCSLALFLVDCSANPQPDASSPALRAGAPQATIFTTTGAAGASAAALPNQSAPLTAPSHVLDSEPTDVVPAISTPVASAVDQKRPAQPSAAGSDAPSNVETWPADCTERFVFRAHSQSESGDISKYAIEAGAERQVLFYFRSPWKSAVNALQLLQSRERIDNPRVIHHWMLYAIDNDTVHRDGEVLEDLSKQSLSALISQQSLLGGIPGGGDVTLPEGVGLHLPSGPNTVYALSLHYMNVTTTAQTDASGIEVCVTDQKREADAATHWLGKMSFELPARSQTDVRATCRPTSMVGPAHIIATTPHMHGFGRHATVSIRRASGAGVTLLDAPYDFAEQRVYDVLQTHSADELLLNQGDQIEVTCTFENSTDSVVRYGESLHDEMCFMNVLAWPVGSLANHVLFARAPGLSEDQSCLEP